MGERPLMLELPAMDALTRAFSELGVSNDSRVVLYTIGTGVAPTARAYLTLDAMGLGARASLLDGGFPVWQSESRPVSTDVPTATKGKLEACPQSDVIANVDYVRDSIRKPGVTIVDARLPAFYHRRADTQRPARRPHPRRFEYHFQYARR